MGVEAPEQREPVGYKQRGIPASLGDSPDSARNGWGPPSFRSSFPALSHNTGDLPTGPPGLCTLSGLSCLDFGDRFPSFVGVDHRGSRRESSASRRSLANSLSLRCVQGNEEERGETFQTDPPDRQVRTCSIQRERGVTTGCDIQSSLQIWGVYVTNCP